MNNHLLSMETENFGDGILCILEGEKKSSCAGWLEGHMILLILKTFVDEGLWNHTRLRKSHLGFISNPPQKSIVRGIEWVEELIVLDPAGSGCIPGGWLDCL